MRPLLLSAEGPFEKPLLTLIGVSLGLHLLLFLLLTEKEPAIQEIPPAIEVSLVDYVPQPEPSSEPLPEPVLRKAPQPVVHPVKAVQAQPKPKAAAKPATTPSKSVVPKAKPARPAASAAKQAPPAPAKPTLELQPRLEGFRQSPALPPRSSNQGQGQPTDSPPAKAVQSGAAKPNRAGSGPAYSGPAPLEPGLVAPQDTARERATLGPEWADQPYQPVEIAEPGPPASRPKAVPALPQVVAPGIVIEGDAAGRQVIYRPPLPRLDKENEVQIVLSFVVLADGSVDQVMPLVKGDAQLETTAMELLARFRFDPAPAGAAPMKGRIRFTLKPGK